MPVVQNNNMEFARTHCSPYRMYWGVFCQTPSIENLALDPRKGTGVERVILAFHELRDTQHVFSEHLLYTKPWMCTKTNGVFKAATN